MTLFKRMLGAGCALLAALAATAAPSPLRAQDAGHEITIGASGEGRPITAIRFGDGPRKLVVVGDTHGGPEANTHVLTTMLIDYFRAHPDEIPASVRLYLIPSINPDGLALGSRFNARWVDLNRNMNTLMNSCAEDDWSTTVEGAYGVVSETGGPYPDSEVENRVLRSFLLDAQGAIFIHSNAGLVFPSTCEHQPSILMAQVYAKGADYVYSRFWDKYRITGSMNDWAGSMGIAAITPELVTGELPEFDQNLAGLKAVLAQAEDIMPLSQDRREAGFAMPEPIWRFWRAYGGAERFGEPLGPATQQGGVTRQTFANAVLELRPDQADTPQLVQPAALGSQYLGAEPAVADDGSGRYFAAAGHNLAGTFLAAWQRADGERVYGAPISEAYTLPMPDGQPRQAQRFERGMLTIDPGSGAVEPQPLGWLAQAAPTLRSPDQPFQMR
ncbi:DUF2817 domain-containing protein [Chloroflexia bacterium SDU3-3]|nr:DUF2817 domain-containing protein [Chloroflexia bacterium SDU3-3]